MKYIALSHRVGPHLQGCIATMGNFDGVHQGHQVLLKRMQEWPCTLLQPKNSALSSLEQRESSVESSGSLPRIVILFEPHPREYLQPIDAPKRILLLPDKLRLLQQYGVDGVLLLHFNRHLSQQSAAHFVETVLVKKLGVRFFVIGDDFRFAKDRQGSIQDIEHAGIEVEVVPALFLEGKRVSSTRARKEIEKADFKALSSLLGHPYLLTGKVVHGRKQGRVLGFPTLNIPLKRQLGLSGVYAVRIWGLDEALVFSGVANVGRRPSMNPLSHPLLEVHVFDYQGDAYQKRVAIEFIEKIRDEQKFESLEALQAKIAEDVEEAKKRIQLCQ